MNANLVIILELSAIIYRRCLRHLLCVLRDLSG